METARPGSDNPSHRDHPTLAGNLFRRAAAALSGIILFASFPPLEWPHLAWVALVPLLMVCASASPRESFKHGFLCGCIFWFTSISWITRVSVIGWIALSLYCAIYLACFSLAVSWWIRRRGIQSRIGNPAVLFAVPALWAALEWLRSTLATGFAWNQLGVSQFNNLVMIQCAEWGGVYIVSYMAALVNTAIALTLLQYRRANGSLRYRPHPELFLSLAVLAIAFRHGNEAVLRFRSPTGSITVAAIQPNVPQTEKWSEEWFEHIYDRLRVETMKAIRQSEPCLVVWPETAVPDFVRDQGPARDLVEEVLAMGVPLLAGSLDYEIADSATNYYNSSFLYQPEAPEPRVYHKQHLVLFGEFIPFEDSIPFLRSLTPVEGSLTAGTVSTVFELGALKHPFGVSICFEDTVARISRAAVLNGARLLINQTNDAWFDPSSASRQQMTHGVFRSIENRVATVRATNTGVTCFIDRNGSIYGEHDTIGPGSDAPTHSAQAVFVPGADMPLTFYTKHGDVFALICLAIAIPIFMGALFELRARAPEKRS